MSMLRTLGYYASVPRTWLQLTAHNTWGILNVLEIIWLRPMQGGLIADNHPFCTGLNPDTGRNIWQSNLLFRTPRRRKRRSSRRATRSSNICEIPSHWQLTAGRLASLG